MHRQTIILASKLYREYAKGNEYKDFTEPYDITRQYAFNLIREYEQMVQKRLSKTKTKLEFADYLSDVAKENNHYVLGYAAKDYKWEDVLVLKNKTVNALRLNGIQTIGDILVLGEKGLRSLPRMGQAAADDIQIQLAEYGIQLKE